MHSLIAVPLPLLLIHRVAMDYDRSRLRIRQWFICLFVGSLALCLAVAQLLSARVVFAVSPTHSSPQLVQRGVDAYRTGQYFQAQTHWKTALATVETAQDQRIILENLARVSTRLGQLGLAADYWQQAIALTQPSKSDAEWGRLSIELAQSYNRLGQYRRALSLLCRSPDSLAETCQAQSVVMFAQAMHNSPELKIAALGSLGETYRLLGNYQQAERYLQQAQNEIYQQVQAAAGQFSADTQPTTSPSMIRYQLPLWQSLGSLYENLAQLSDRRANSAEQIGDTEVARQLRQQAVGDETRAKEIFLRGFAHLQDLEQSNANLLQQFNFLLKLIPIYQRLGELESLTSTQAQTMELLSVLPDSQEKALGMVRLAQLLQGVEAENSAQNNFCPSTSQFESMGRLLQTGLAVAEGIGDRRSEAFAQGALGHLAECQANPKVALQWTQAARAAASQDPLGKDSQYQWDWQLGRILSKMGRSTEARIAYQTAIATLNEIRADILTASPELRFDFRDTIEPIYRELAALELEQIPSAQVLAQTTDQNQLIRQTLQTVDSLKLAELQNYFGRDCLVTPTAAVIDFNQQQSRTAVISTIIFPQRTAVIANFPDGSTQVEWIEQNQAILTKTINRFRRGLESYFREFEPDLAQQLYGWLIQPFEAQLATDEIQTLVFVQDGILRTVPMGALHDGKQFLIEHYAIATTPSLELTDPKALAPERLQALALGLTDAVTVDQQRFEPLPFVGQEVASVAAQLADTQTLLNEDFSRDRLRQSLNQQRYPILHIATHGQFGAEPEDNFIVTGTGEKLTISELDRLIRQLEPTGDPIELLALTACETAIGDERATLGLAGVALRAGARSAIASLWSINDAATAELVEQFYRGLLNPQLNKAEALQAAQMALIQQGGEMAHPARWAPLILIGNWL